MELISIYEVGSHHEYIDMTPNSLITTIEKGSIKPSLVVKEYLKNRTIGSLTLYQEELLDNNGMTNGFGEDSEFFCFDHKLTHFKKIIE